MVHIPKAAAVVEAKNVPNKVADLETRIHKLETDLEHQRKIFNDQAQLFVAATNKTGGIAKAVKALLVKLGAEVPPEVDEAIETTMPSPEVPTSVTAPE